MIRIIGLAVFAFAFIPATLSAQLLSFSSFYGNGHHPVAFHEELNGSYTLAFDPPALCLTDPAATPVSFNLLLHPGVEQIIDLIPSVNGGYYLAGHGNSGLFLMEVDLALQPLWFRTYGGVTARQVQLTPDGGFIFCGETSGTHKILVVKTNSVGVLEWSREIDLENGDENPIGVTRLKFGTYVVAGSLLRNGQANRLSFLLQLDNGGNVLRAILLQTGNPQLALSVAPTSTGGFLLGGYSVVAGEDRAFMARFDSVLQPMWSRTMWPDSIGQVRQVIEGDGRFVSVSTVQVGSDSLDKQLLVAQWNELGNVVWAGRLDEAGIDRPLDLGAEGGDIHICGQLASTGAFDGFLRKFTPNSAEDCITVFASSPTNPITSLLDTLPYSVQAGPSSTVDSTPLVQPFSIFSNLLCSTVGVEENEAVNWTTYPNPASGTFRLEGTEEIDGCSLRLLDIQGREMWRETLSKGQIGRSFSLPENGAAVYFLEITSDQGRIVKKILNQP